MIDRDDVETLLWRATEYPGDSIVTSAARMAELCRCWLAVDSAPEVTIEDNDQVPGTPDFDYGDMLSAVMTFTPGTRVRLVPLATAKGGE